MTLLLRCQNIFLFSIYKVVTWVGQPNLIQTLFLVRFSDLQFELDLDKNMSTQTNLV